MFEKYIIKRYEKLGITLDRCLQCGKLCENGLHFCSDRCFKKSEKGVKKKNDV